MNISVSVIVPVYNCEKYIVRCADSILNQSFDDFELLLIDDGSVDGSPEMCDKYAEKDERVRVFHIPNRGVSYARNFGIEKSAGKFICFVDGDDYVERDYLNLLVENSLNGEIYPVCQVYNADRNGAKKIYYEPNFDPFSGLQAFSNKNTIQADGDLLILNANQGWSVRSLFSKEVLDKFNIRFDVNIKMMEDKLFVMNYINHIDREKIKYIRVPLYNYADNPGGAVNSYKQDYYAENKRYISLLKKIYDESSLSEEIKNVSVMTESEINIWCVIRQEISFDYKRFRKNIKSILFSGLSDDIKELLLNNRNNISKSHILIYELLIKKLYLMPYLILKLKKI